MRTHSRLLIISALSLTAAREIDAQGSDTRRDPPTVESTGLAQRRVAPDRANVNLIVETKAESAAEAASANSRAVQAVLDTLRRAALDSAVTTGSFHVGPNYERGVGAEPRQSGYMARTVLRARLTRLDNVGRVIDVGLAKGATGVESVGFESSTAEDTRRSAVADAASAARRDAEALARALGGSLGPLISTSTLGRNDPRVFYEMAGMAGGSVSLRGATQINPSEIVITAGVMTRWQFIPR